MCIDDARGVSGSLTFWIWRLTARGWEMACVSNARQRWRLLMGMLLVVVSIVLALTVSGWFWPLAAGGLVAIAEGEWQKRRTTKRRSSGRV